MCPMNGAFTVTDPTLHNAADHPTPPRLLRLYRDVRPVPRLLSLLLRQVRRRDTKLVEILV